MIRPLILLALTTLMLLGCAVVPRADAPQVAVAGIESLPGEGLEVRMLVKLRVQNPNDTPIDFNGVYVRFDVRNKVFATGVSNQAGTVPRYGEVVIGVPVTVSMLRMARQMIGLLDGKPVDKISYQMMGKLNATKFRTLRFKSEGEFKLPNSPVPAEEN